MNGATAAGSVGPRCRGLTLLEVLIAMTLFVCLLVPVMSMSVSANRIGFAANRLLEVTLYGQMILEGLQRVAPEEFEDFAKKKLAKDERYPIHQRVIPVGLAFFVSPPAPGALSKLETVIKVLESSVFPYEVRQELTMVGTGTDHVGIELTLVYARLPTEPGSTFSLILKGTVTRPSP